MTKPTLHTPRIVLDTNVCLDLFVFGDPSCLPLRAALEAGSVQAVTREDCREEWLRVLHYPRLPIDAESRPAFANAFDVLVHCLPSTELPPDDDTPLPRCTDPDDQKFLELAHSAGARWLLSKDNALLALDRRTRGPGWFAILQPHDWRVDETAPAPSTTAAKVRPAWP